MDRITKEAGWTKAPHNILEAMPFMDMPELKLTAVLLRQTFGWKRNQVRMTWDDMQQVAQIKGRASIGKAIEAVGKRGFFVRGRKSMWFINSSIYELFTGPDSSDQELKFTSNSSYSELDSLGEGSEDELKSSENSSRNEPNYSSTTKEKKKEKSKEEIDPVAELANHFTTVTSIFPSRGNYAEEWERPLAMLVEKTPNLETAKAKLERAYEFARNPGNGQGRYTIRAPVSLMTIVANLPDEYPAVNGKPREPKVITILTDNGPEEVEVTV